VEDQQVEIVSNIGQDEFRLGARDADRPDEETEAVLLMGEDMLDRRADRGLGSICPRYVLRHRLACGLAAMDPADQPFRGQPCVILLRAIGAIGPDIRRMCCPSRSVAAASGHRHAMPKSRRIPG
jgi:hypothetical protein